MESNYKKLSNRWEQLLYLFVFNCFNNRKTHLSVHKHTRLKVGFSYCNLLCIHFRLDCSKTWLHECLKSHSKVWLKFWLPVLMIYIYIPVIQKTRHAIKAISAGDSQTSLLNMTPFKWFNIFLLLLGSAEPHRKAPAEIMMLIYFMKVIHNSSFVHQPRGRIVEWQKTNKQVECEFPTEKVSQGWKKYVAKCQRDSLLFGRLAGRRSDFDLFVWPGLAQTTVPVLPQTQ